MKMNLISMAKALLSIKECYIYHLDYKELKEKGIKSVSDEDFDIYIFDQIWGNTSGGFEGIGGCAMTTQTTYVLVSNVHSECLVFFGGGFAYKVPYSREFMEDVVNHNVAGKHSYGKYLRKE